jgi:hypothetical protein
MVKISCTSNMIVGWYIALLTNLVRWWCPYGKASHWKSPQHSWCARHLYELLCEELPFINWFIWYYNFELVKIILGKEWMIAYTIWNDSKKVGWLAQSYWLWTHACLGLLLFLIGTLIMFESNRNPNLQCKYMAIVRWHLQRH